jgi:hypothetical protein
MVGDHMWAAKKGIDALIAAWKAGATLQQIESILDHLATKPGSTFSRPGAG